MAPIVRFFAALVRWLRRSPAEREAEIVYLRQQLVVLKRTAQARPRLKATDRLIFVCLYCLFPSLLDASIIFKPVTLLHWHRTGFRLFWRWKSRRRPGRPAVPADIRSLFRRISRENGDVDPNQVASLKADDHQSIEQPEADGRHDKHIDVPWQYDPVLAYHPNAGLAYCIGDLLFWGGWSPRPLGSETAGRWPASVLGELDANTLPIGG